MARCADLVGGTLANLERKGDVLEDRQMREQRVVLKHHADVAPMRRFVGHVAAIDADASARRVTNPAIIISVVVLPEPLGPSSVRNSPIADVERYVAHGTEGPVLLARDHRARTLNSPAWTALAPAAASRRHALPRRSTAAAARLHSHLVIEEPTDPSVFARCRGFPPTTRRCR